VLPDSNNLAAQLFAKLSTLVYLVVPTASAETCFSLDDPVTVSKILCSYRTLSSTFKVYMKIKSNYVKKYIYCRRM
jgi:hypothetical protein